MDSSRLYDERNAQITTKPAPASRVDRAIVMVNESTGRIRRSTDRIIAHAKALGFYEEPPAPPAPVATNPSNMSAALNALENAVNELDVCLDLFD